ncbi:Na+/H+ antiporter NhaC family protein [Bacillus mojavensis]|uniref:Na+/H+ antiporter NhaC family protein n=1 Tax=Bacillus TaxID=1386 RepID=UPI002DBA7DBF|nr:Na+/H+ antiporter NhaC family protein [Bacillus mojavensis]MEC1678905.1 Na+/H+ antiporter NhaC family protein [Bacillus mojavensis]MEC1688745.1 Na+/H+ antiporter NhaC family protein [Bacillus mojavensis]MEC1713034.1 Na+/H+ antiporter NhaC family protein [Bacillus mojavensis]
MKQNGNPWALLPLVLFVGLFVGSGVLTGDFYKLPILIAAIIASAFALLFNQKQSLNQKIEWFASGAGHPDIIIMVIIFILAGAFASAAEAMGAVHSTVNLALSIIPQQFILPGLFIIACFISVSMGTSMGTIAAVTPISAGLSGELGLPTAIAIAAVVGGAMFGDNLSFISDTTIAAVRSQKTQMMDKFKTNFLIVLPAAIITVILLFFIPTGHVGHIGAESYSWFKVLPYVAVLVFALIGFNVVAVIFGGLILTGIIGFASGSLTLESYFKSITDGIAGMSDLIILSMLIGGMVGIMKQNGGIDFLLGFISKRIRSKKGAEAGIAGLVSVTNLATANNTIAIIAAGPIAKNISDEFKIDNRKSASILDIFSCVIQGLIPYGAQMLSAGKFGNISPVSILHYSFYPVLIGICGILAIIFGLPKFTRNPK